MPTLSSERHTAGDTTQWGVDYCKWIDNTGTIVSATVASSSTTCTIVTPAPAIQGTELLFSLTGGRVGETFTVSLVMTDSFANVKNDTIYYTVVAA